MLPLSILIKPSSSACNLHCKYCFYRSVSTARETESFGLMPLEILEQLVKNALSVAEGYCCFAFQGGEPTLMGLAFYRQLMAFEKQYNTRGIVIENTIQTNGILIDDAWAEFLAENHFLVGLSLDGPGKINDIHRVRCDGAGSFKQVMNAVSLLKKYKADFNILSVITAQAAERPEYLYRFFCRRQFRFLQFIPCLDETSERQNGFSLKPGQYGKFLVSMFRQWQRDFTAGQDIEIRLFTNLVQMAAGYPAEACGMCGRCTPYPVIEADGSVYPCDFYVTEQWKLGTVETSLIGLLHGKKAEAFAAVSNAVDQRCCVCEHFDLCRGGCRRWREPIVNGMPSLNSLCQDYQYFFDHCKQDIFKLARRYLGTCIGPD